MNQRVIPTLVHNFGTTLESIRLHVIDFRPDLRFLNPRSDTWLEEQEEPAMEETSFRIPLQGIAEHTKLILRSCPVLRKLSVRFQHQPDDHVPPVTPRTGISLQDLVDMEWACSKTIQTLELEIWDPPTPGPAPWAWRFPLHESTDGSNQHDDDSNDPSSSLFKDFSIKEGNDTNHFDERFMYRPYPDETTYLADCSLYPSWRVMLYAKNEAKVDVRTAAEAASLVAKAAREQIRTLGPHSETLDQLLEEIHNDFENALEDAITEAEKADNNNSIDKNTPSQRFVRRQWLLLRAIRTVKQIYRLLCRLKALPNLKSLNLYWLSPQHQMYLEDGLWLLQRCALDEETRLEEMLAKRMKKGGDGIDDDDDGGCGSRSDLDMGNDAPLKVRPQDISYLNLEWVSRERVLAQDKEAHYSGMGIHTSQITTGRGPESEESGFGHDFGTLLNRVDVNGLDLSEDEYDSYEVFKSRSRDKRTQFSKQRKIGTPPSK